MGLTLHPAYPLSIRPLLVSSVVRIQFIGKNEVARFNVTQFLLSGSPV